MPSAWARGRSGQKKKKKKKKIKTQSAVEPFDSSLIWICHLYCIICMRGHLSCHFFFRRRSGENSTILMRADEYKSCHHTETVGKKKKNPVQSLCSDSSVNLQQQKKERRINRKTNPLWENRRLWYKRKYNFLRDRIRKQKRAYEENMRQPVIW